MATIDFLHDGSAYCGETLRTTSLGGIENCVVHLAEALAKRGHDVTVFNGIRSSADEFGVKWRPLAEATRSARGEIAIAVASAKVLRQFRFRKPFLWLHNPLKASRVLRRGEAFDVLKARPHLVVLGNYHGSRVPSWLPFRTRSTLHHGIGESFFRSEPAETAPSPRAIFTSQPYRGLDWLLDLWPGIRQSVPNAVFDVFAPKDHQARANAGKTAHEGVVFRGNFERAALASEARTARVQFIPGHPDETYCLAAAEAVASGVPVVTLGIGALSERVVHGKTGFISRDAADFAAHAVKLLNDDALWLGMHRACLADKALATWDARALEWELLLAGD